MIIKSITSAWMLLLLASSAAFAQDARNELPKKQHRTSDAPFLKPDEAVKKMAIPDGFDVSVFAAEPDIAEPIAFCFDDKGRMWIVENFNYQTRGKHIEDKQISRIQILEDTNGDGIFDKKKTFTDKLTFTSGIALGHGGVFVGSPPNFSFIPDRDGNDVPDGPPEILLDGWGFHDRHETLNSFIWGPDGWLYGCHGVFTRSEVGKPNCAKEDRQFIDGGIWRYHPTRNKFEIHARGLSNPWGFDFDDHGQGFATCCVIPHLFHIVQGGVYHKQSLPHVNPHIYDDIKTIRDHTHLSAHGGARFYLADAFPKPYNERNYLFMCNIHEHAVLTDFMQPNGSSFIGKHGDDFMPTNDLAWVGFSIEIGPEGGVYVLDWHDTDICGNAINFPNSGRVYRIMPKKATPITPPNLRAMSSVELAQLQTHDNDWYVRQSRTLLQDRANGDIAEAQETLTSILNSDVETRKKLRAMWALYVTNAFDEAGLTTLLDHSDEHIRGWAIRFLCDESPLNAFQDTSKLQDSIVGPDVLEKFTAMARDDSSAVVRRFLSSAVQRMPFADRWPILDALASHSEDAADNNLPRMIWFGLEPMVPHHPEKALALAINGKMPQLAEFVARRLTTGDVASQVNRPRKPQKNEKRVWQRIIQKSAPGFKVHDVGEGGVVDHSVFRNATAVQTHPLDRETPSTLRRQLKIPEIGRTKLNMRVSHHPHGDWQLRVLANGELLADQIVGSKTVANDEWLDVSVDLSNFAGQTVKLTIENKANDWQNEWAYWNRVSVDTEQEVGDAKKKTKVVFISGHPSHGRMKHEHRAGNMILANALNDSGLNIDAELVPHYGYPQDESILKDAATIVIFSTGHSGHVLKKKLDEFDALMNGGTGVVMLHWSTEAEKGKMGDLFLNWMGGFCDLDWSVNPHWKPNFNALPDHAICRGVEPFSVDDEWYYHMRFVEGMKGITPILTDVPPAHTLRRPDGERSGNTAVRRAVANGETQHVAWAYQRPGGGRGFGFTGGHNHESWQDDNFRKIVLNAILWTANVEVPEDGCANNQVDDALIKQNIDDQ
ncbi:PVC-type heme-binding CxxCH protein [Mariniblastus fucicola]|uniref:Trehalose utilization n=1 Tax=Mariniblastus fucicola TaxID=980251 RepID=A0A5B9P8N7_9BACT|nr:PVC-type heme-binding CxxCH protein [Mariniblastus fucicola]QEG21575.1 Trehalose utilization [Mariniblastus fucicola]